MLTDKDTLLFGHLQSFTFDRAETEGTSRTVSIYMRSTRVRQDFVCPSCGSGHIHQNGLFDNILRDMPGEPGQSTIMHVPIRRFECQTCRHVFREDNELAYPHAHVTMRMARWAKALLSYSSISEVSRHTRIGWETLKRIHKDDLLQNLSDRRKRQKNDGYRPKYLAVDEFSIRKGHKYATSVMDAETGEVLWVGEGRTMEAFSRFFADKDIDGLLSEVKAVAMDMNASYHSVVKRHLPEAEIVYDRYHMEAQYGRDVMGSVRLEKARENSQKAKEDAENGRDPKAHKREYSRLKGSRWLLLGRMVEDNEELKAILDDYADIATCFALKERMKELFLLKDREKARSGWEEWFSAARKSGIRQLVNFAEQKEKRIEGLISHAEHQIGTGRLEGTNNKIKVLKRIAFGYRDNEYFFALIRYLTIPKSHN